MTVMSTKSMQQFKLFKDRWERHAVPGLWSPRRQRTSPMLKHKGIPKTNETLTM